MSWRSPYVARATPCWASRHCGKDTLVFDWPKDRRWDWATPPHPIPRTVKRAFLKERGRHYWGNTCIHAGGKQGDVYIDQVFEECEGPSPDRVVASVGVEQQR